MPRAGIIWLMGSNEIDEVGLGKKLQLARQQAGLTQQQLAQKAELSYSTLAKIERGAIKSPSVFTIHKLAAYVGSSLDTLMGVSKGSADPAVIKSAIKFVYFDINGCLVRFFHRAFSFLAEESGTPSDQIETMFWHYNDAVNRGEMTMDHFDRILSQTVRKAEVHWLDYYMKAVEPMSGMNELVEEVSHDYSVGLLSNIMPGCIDTMLKSHTIPTIDYKAVVDSSEVGAIKPETKIYEIAQGLAGVEPQEILFIDDARANLMAAERLGWKVMWFDDYNPEESVKKIRQTLQV